jgi:renalase
MRRDQKVRIPRIAIIGAGMAGISCAHALRGHGLVATLFEKSHGIGGRLSTRRNDAGDCFDHGAQYITTQSPEFSAFMGALQGAGSAAPWNPDVKDPTALHRHLWFVGTPGMSALLKPLISDLDLRNDTTISALHRHDEGWQLQTHDGVISEGFDIVISTAPVVQTRALLAVDPMMHAQLDAVMMAPCWALMLTFRAPLDPGFDAHRFDSGATSWLKRQVSRPGHAERDDTWVLHASAPWSVEHLERTADEVAALLQEDLARAIGRTLPDTVFVQAHRWRYAMTTHALDQPFLANADRSLFAGGDWCLGARVECAYQSGTSIADAVAKNFTRRHDPPA